jgi:hypothetical protein
MSAGRGDENSTRDRLASMNKWLLFSHATQKGKTEEDVKGKLRGSIA